MAILQYWCPKHHTTKRLSRFDKWIDWEGWNGKERKASFRNITPICQICRKEMVYAGSNLPKKKRKKENKIFSI